MRRSCHLVWFQRHFVDKVVQTHSATQKVKTAEWKHLEEFITKPEPFKPDAQTKYMLD